MWITICYMFCFGVSKRLTTAEVILEIEGSIWESCKMALLPYKNYNTASVV